MEGEDKGKSIQGPATSGSAPLYTRARTMTSDMPQGRQQPPSPLKKPATETKVQAPRRKMSIIIFLVIVVLLIGAGAYVYRTYRSLLFTGSAPPVLRLEPPAPFVGIETTQTLTITNENKGTFRDLLTNALSREERTGSFKRILILLKEPTGDRYGELKDLFGLLSIAPTSLFFTPIEAPLMSFAYYGTDGPHFGFMTRTNDRERVLQAMARWEETLWKDFDPLFLGSAIPRAGLFEEFSYRNTNYRYLASLSDPERGIAYMVFPAGRYLVVTTSRESMEELIERLFDSL